MLTISQIKEIFRENNFRPLKRLGANYLIDSNIKDKMVRYIGALTDDTVLEIGPGLGALTIDLADAKAKVIAVDKDKKACGILREIVQGRYPRLEIYNKDILKYEIKKLYDGKKIKIAGNLPYYITTPIIEWIIRNRRYIQSAVLMVQKEVARRYMAKPGDDEYGSISCFVTYYAEPEYLCTVKSSSFYPKPEVDSAIMRLKFLDQPAVKVDDEELFFRIVRGAFNQRRKSILNSLSRDEVLAMPKDKLSATLCRAGIDPSARPETLGLSDFARIANSIRIA